MLRIMQCTNNAMLHAGFFRKTSSVTVRQIEFFPGVTVEVNYAIACVRRCSTKFNKSQITLFRFIKHIFKDSGRHNGRKWTMKRVQTSQLLKKWSVKEMKKEDLEVRWDDLRKRVHWESGDVIIFSAHIFLLHLNHQDFSSWPRTYGPLFVDFFV